MSEVRISVNPLWRLHLGKWPSGTKINPLNCDVLKKKIEKFPYVTLELNLVGCKDEQACDSFP